MTRPVRPIRARLLPRSAATGPRAFTLIELLVVLALIVLALAAAVPAFSYITGSRSTDSAQNMVAAMLQRARSLAIQNGQTTGVFFFVNPASNRATMALVATAAGEDQYANYRGWTSRSFQQNTSAGTGWTFGGPPYSQGQEVVALYLRDNGPGNKYSTPSDQYTHAARTFSRDNSAANDIGNTNNQAPLTSGSGSTETSPAPWSQSDSVFDIVPDTDLETLPANVAVQLINDPKGQIGRDHYLQTGVILFDPEGRLISMPYYFRNDVNGQSEVVRLLQIPASAANPKWPQVPPVTNPVTQPIYSQVGLVLYDRSVFLNQPNFTEQDLSVLVRGQPTLGTAPVTPAQEATEETWLDQNTTPLFVDRSNGTLLKGQ